MRRVCDAPRFTDGARGTDRTRNSLTASWLISRGIGARTQDPHSGPCCAAEPPAAAVTGVLPAWAVLWRRHMWPLSIADEPTVTEELSF